MSCGVSPAMMMSTLPPTRAWVASGPLANSTGFTELTPAGFSHSCSLPLSNAKPSGPLNVPAVPM